MFFHRPTWHDRNVYQGMKFMSGTNTFSCLLHCCDWICHSAGLCSHTWFTQRSSVSDSCYSRSLTACFFRERFIYLSPVLHHREKSITCWAWLVWWKSKSMRIRNPFLLGILGGTDLQPWHWTEWNSGFFRSINSSELPLACICALSWIHSLGLKLDLLLAMGYLVNSPLLSRYLLNEDILHGREEGAKQRGRVACEHSINMDQAEENLKPTLTRAFLATVNLWKKEKFWGRGGFSLPSQWFPLGL